MQSFRSWGASLVLCAAFVLACSSFADNSRQSVPSSGRDILALKPAGTNAVIVHAIGYGSGVIQISDPSQTCVSYEWGESSNHYSQVCWAYVPVATSSVTVTATANNGSQFTGWGSLCTSSTEGACTIATDQDRTLTVGFVPKPPEPKTEYVLSVRVLGFVDGNISAYPDVGLACSPGQDAVDVISVNYARTCTAVVPNTTPPTQVTLSATPIVAGTQFAGWGGSCGGTGTCTVRMDRDVGITASFVRTAAGTAPALSVTPATGLRGTPYAVSGTGFTPNSRVEVYLQMPDGSVSNTAVTSDAQGAFVWTYDSTAADQYGQFTCRAVDFVSGITSNTASFTMTAVVTPAVSVSPTTGGRGTTFSETGSGFTPGGNVTLHFRQPDGTETPTVTRVADSNGAYTHSWTSSATSLLGTYLYWSVDTASGIVSNTVSFTVTSSTSGSFSATGSLSGVRAYHTATLLTDGKVLIAGGFDGAFDVASAEIYDPATASFSQTGAMVTPRGDHAAVRLRDGRVLLVGGRGAYRDLASAEIFDPATGQFTATGRMSTNRRYPTATLLPNGTVLVTGGVVDTNTWTGLATAEVYDPTSGQFTATGSMRTTRYGHTATLLATGAVLVAGGTVGAADLTSAEVYDPIAGTFAPTGDMSAPRAGHTATLLRSGKVLLAGGYANAQHAAFTAEIYDPALGGFSLAGSLHDQRDDHTATLRGDGTVLIAGGFVTATAEVYDPVAGTFVPTASMALPRYKHTAVLLGNGAVLVAGGLGRSPVYTATAELYR